MLRFSCNDPKQRYYLNGIMEYRHVNQSQPISTELEHQLERLQNVQKSNSEKNKKEEDDTKKWKRFSVSLSRFVLDNVSDFKIVDKLVLKLLMSVIVSQEYGVLQLSIKILGVLTQPVR